MGERDAGRTRADGALPVCGASGDAAVEWARLARVARALGDPIRLQMLDLMGQGRSCCGLPDPPRRGVPGAADSVGICVCEFQEQFGIGQSRVSYHLRVLRECGLIREETHGKWSFYSVDREAVTSALNTLRLLLRV